MKFFETNQIKLIDNQTIEMVPIQSIDLMEKAAEAIFQWIVYNIPSSNKVIVFAGPGNNGGDGLALARLLITVGYDVRVFILNSIPYSNDLQENINRLKKQGIVYPVFVSNSLDFPAIEKDNIIIDALFGSGLSRPIEGVAGELINHINQSGTTVISIDIPSGLFGEENPNPNPNNVIKASFTLTLQFPKLSFFYAENEKYTGKWIVLPIGLDPQVIENTPSDYCYISEENISPLLKQRNTFDHKGTFGHVLLIAGSYGMLGASVLTSKACMVSGVGLVTAHIPRLGYSVLQHSVPEALVSVDDNDWYFTGAEISKKYNAIAIGPGIGTETRTVAGFREILKNSNVPLLIDADGINIIAKHPEFIKLIPKNTVITPHPGEFDRLFGKTTSSYHRFSIAKRMAKENSLIIVLKGAFTQVFAPDGKVYFNSTGNPGMATAGSGDVLTGIIAGMLGQGYQPLHAAILGVFIHGLGGDLAARTKGYASTISSDIISNIGNAFKYAESNLMLKKN